MTEDNSEVVSVICIDKGTIEKVTNDDRIRPLYSQFRTNLENTLVPYKLRGVQVSTVLLLQLKGIQDKNSVAQFWSTNFPLLFAADFQANPIDISCKK